MTADDTLPADVCPASFRPTRDRQSCAPLRPSFWEEQAASWLFRALSPRLGKVPAPEVPASLGSGERFEIARPRSRGHLAATWYPAETTPRGAVLLVHPWTPWGQAYFYRRRRITALRSAGYHALIFDLGGFGTSGPAPAGFYDTDVEAALDALARRAPGLPLHLWGVSAGAYWSHPVLSRRDDVCGAVFEDVSHHLIEYSKRMAPWGMPAYWVFEHVTRRAWRFLDLRRHAPHMRLTAAAYIGGELDRGVRPEETRALARLASADCLVVRDAGHLDAIRRAGEDVVDLALKTLARAVGERAPCQRGGKGGRFVPL